MSMSLACSSRSWAPISDAGRFTAGEEDLSCLPKSCLNCVAFCPSGTVMSRHESGSRARLAKLALVAEVIALLRLFP